MVTVDEAAPAEKRMRLRYAGVCRLCAAELPAGHPAYYEKSSRTVHCVECPSGQPVTDPVAVAGATPLIPVGIAPEPVVMAPEPVDIAPEPVVDEPEPASAPGGSAMREYERRRAKDEQEIRDRWGRLSGVALFLSSEKQTTAAWRTGAVGEQQLGDAMSERWAGRYAVLHDRGIRGTRANIDHLVVTEAGAWVIDAKRYRGKRPDLKVEGGLIRPVTRTLTVGGRDCTKLVQGVQKQVGLVQDALGPEVPVTGILCFVEADWPLFGGTFTVDGVHVLYPKAMYKMLETAPGIGLDVAAMERTLAATFPPAKA